MDKPPRGSLTLICSRPGEAEGFAKPFAKLTGFNKNYHLGAAFIKLAHIKVGHSLIVLKLNLIIMKELSFERMEKIQGGDYSYCQLICYWITGGSGYQGDFADLWLAWSANCQPYCNFPY